MITKRTDAKIRRARGLVSSALMGNNLKGYQELGLRPILKNLNKWLDEVIAHIMPEDK